ncbi:serine hydrolase [Paenibacillus sp. IB182496]|uniref:Serine hydrolase n=1 Tax=Paenibacillus sabuli TaxID=2772509 RepID=A0A927GRX2_9BACL|nr:serine hydrolase [Paenibacillus sabuli]MBD2845430.1 serine hydrolase [Paenibacillus sabuli]
MILGPELRSEMQALELNSCLLYREGRLLDTYEEAPGASGEQLPINSCTKSVLSALICMAMAQGRFPAPETPVIECFDFGSRKAAAKNEHDSRAQITVEHLLTLTAGFQWSEFGGSKSFPTMTRSADWIEYVWTQPMANAPGSKWVYNSGVSQLLAHLLRQAVGMPVARYAERELFGPLGIRQYAWKTDPHGTHTGGYGLELSALDLLKLGRLYLQNGVWEGDSLLPRSLTDHSVAPAIAVSPPERGYYGWHWWADAVTPEGEDAAAKTVEPLSYFYARGYGGQFVIVVPSRAAVVVLTRRPRKKGESPHEWFRRRLAPLLV